MRGKWRKRSVRGGKGQERDALCTFMMQPVKVKKRQKVHVGSALDGESPLALKNGGENVHARFRKWSVFALR